MLKERLETGAISNPPDKIGNGAKLTETFIKKAPNWLGRLFALAVIIFTTSEDYHIESNYDNTPPQSKVAQEPGFPAIASLSLKAVIDYYNTVIEAELETSASTPSSTPTPTSVSTPTPIPTQPLFLDDTVQQVKVGDELSPITGYYCEQIPGYPVGDGGGYCGPTASGQLPRLGTAACGEKWPLGTRVRITGYGEVTCLDRGYLGWNQVDVFFPTNRDLAESNLPSEAVVEVVGQE